MTRNVFKDTVLEIDFQKNGYTKISFLDDDEINLLKQAYFNSLPNSKGAVNAEIKDQITYDFTFIDKNIAYKQEVFEIITDAFNKQVNFYLNNYKPIIANFIRKKNEGGEVPLHQNWAFVDEKKCTSVSIWCPLVDSDEQNGTLQIVPGSHKRFGLVRGPMIPWELDNIKQDIIANDLVPMNINAGDAIVLDDSVVHYSNINQTNELRLAIQLILIPKEFVSIHYHLNPQKNKNKVQVLEVDKDFYMHFNPWKEAENVKVQKSFNYQTKYLDYKAFKQKLFNDRIDEDIEKETWYKKLFS